MTIKVLKKAGLIKQDELDNNMVYKTALSGLLNLYNEAKQTVQKTQKADQNNRPTPFRSMRGAGPSG